MLSAAERTTELLESAGGGIALERVHGAADASQCVGVARIALKEDPRFVQLLQQILRALKEEFAKFNCALIGKKCQTATSMR
jgi:hypothetical protein